MKPIAQRAANEELITAGTQRRREEKEKRFFTTEGHSAASRNRIIPKKKGLSFRAKREIFGFTNKIPRILGMTDSPNIRAGVSIPEEELHSAGGPQPNYPERGNVPMPAGSGAPSGGFDKSPEDQAGRSRMGGKKRAQKTENARIINEPAS